MSNTYLEHLRKNTPHQPGVYRFKNSEQQVIYVGKAKNLHKRVNSYFSDSKQHSTRTLKMRDQITDIEYTTASSELEALILETNLIKNLRPKYNILMKDDKNFAYIKITINEDYPRILIVRKIQNDHARYFGPKTAASQIYRTLNLLRKIFPFRTCNLQIENIAPAPIDDINKKQLVKVSKATIKYPCLDLHIKRCLGPCVGKADHQQYRQTIEKIIAFLDGKFEEVITHLTTEMQEAAKHKRFEQAAKLRDKITSIQNIYQNQLVSDPNQKNLDVVNYFNEHHQAYFNIFQVRQGKLIDQQNLIIEHGETLGETLRTEELMGQFLQQFYTETPNIPEEILLPHKAENQELISKYLHQTAQHKVTINTPQKGNKDKLLTLSLENAHNFAKQNRARWEGSSIDQRQNALETIAQTLGLPTLPKRIECFDISHLAGTHTVASMVVMENGLPKTDQYRHFKINLPLQPGSPDDFRSMEEVILRRLKYLKPSLTFKEFKLTKIIDSSPTTYRFKKGKSTLLDIQIISSTKLKTLIAPLTLPTENIPALVQKIIDKFNSKRIYLAIPQNQISQLEDLGFQQIRDQLDNYQDIPPTDVVVVYDKTRHHQDNSFQKIPDLIVIDGGKGQLGSAVKAMKEYNFKIPIVSLAKKQEEFFLPGKSKSIQLTPADPARLLIQQIRDEAHRFAIEYNRKLRKNDYTVSALEQIPGIGKTTAQKVLKTFGSIEQVKQTPVETLAKSIGLKNAIKIHSFLQ